MRFEEPYQGILTCVFGLLERGPCIQEVAEDDGVFLIEQAQYQGIVVFQSCRQSVGNAHFIANQSSSHFDQLPELSDALALGCSGV